MAVPPSARRRHHRRVTGVGLWWPGAHYGCLGRRGEHGEAYRGSGEARGVQVQPRDEEERSAVVELIMPALWGVAA
jgi:hypothetical protein